MCTICGCQGSDGATFDKPQSSGHHNHGGHHHNHDHDHVHVHGSDEEAHGDGRSSASPHDGDRLRAIHAPGTSKARIVQVEQDILGENNRYAAANRAWLSARRVLALNLVSSPGSGKTTLLVRTIADLLPSHTIAVVEGDQQTAFDAERIRNAGAPSVQINTGRGCHLDAHMVGHALDRLQPAADSVLFIENVGNLVCPAAFDLGEACKVVTLSVTEGEDKPLKYPDMFQASRLMLLTKVDLLPYVPFDVDRCLENARRVNPDIELLQISAVSGTGLSAWYDWLESNRTGTGVQPDPQIKATA